MSPMDVFRRMGIIATNTCLEAVRQRFFNVLAIMSAALVGGSFFFRQFDFDTSELKFVADFGFGAILFFGSILAVVIAAQLFFNEIENRTALTLLAKPVHKFEFIGGKFLGVLVVMLCFVLVMSALLCGMLFWRESELMQRYPDAFASGRIVNYGSIMLYGVLQGLKFGVLGALTILVASFARTQLYTLMVSFFAMLICQLQHVAQDVWRDAGSLFMRGFLWAVSMLFPNFQVFNIGDLVAAGEAVGSGNIIRIVLYALAYTVVYCGLAVYCFRHREI